MKSLKEPFLTVVKIILVFVLFSSCATGPKYSQISLSSLKGQVVRSLQDREKIGKSLRGSASFRWSGQKQAEILLLVKRPLDFRFDVVSDFGYYLQQAVSLSGLFTVIWYEENRYFRGVGTSEQVGRYLSIKLTPREVVSFLLGSPPIEEEENYELFPLRKRDYFILRGERSEITVRKMGTEYLPVKYRALDIGGEALYSIEYDDYSEDSLFPYRIRGRFRGKRIEIAFEEVELNPSLPRDLFEIEIPEGADRIYDD
ncbi:MAG: DUF4292 domain-containing protein [Deltaproteobacteria bacterium]|nr:DUF4292 domain-containing protein [Deltaproteobacteria bacterium]